ncbi:MAG: hypothetical protein EXQ58_09695 [Acidobacteria bacterium]|nr:hypothetical protein [Acidobacteriota bacterium]
MGRKLSASGYQFQTLISEIVESLPFQSRHGKALLSKEAGKPKNGARQQSRAKRFQGERS